MWIVKSDWPAIASKGRPLSEWRESAALAFRADCSKRQSDEGIYQRIVDRPILSFQHSDPTLTNVQETEGGEGNDLVLSALVKRDPGADSDHGRRISALWADQLDRVSRRALEMTRLSTNCTVLHVDVRATLIFRWANSQIALADRIIDDRLNGRTVAEIDTAAPPHLLLRTKNDCNGCSSKATLYPVRSGVLRVPDVSFDMPSAVTIAPCCNSPPSLARTWMQTFAYCVAAISTSRMIPPCG